MQTLLSQITGTPQLLHAKNAESQQPETKIIDVVLKRKWSSLVCGPCGRLKALCGVLISAIH
jgi:hypothetical protein